MQKYVCQVEKSKAGGCMLFAGALHVWERRPAKHRNQETAEKDLWQHLGKKLTRDSGEQA